MISGNKQHLPIKTISNEDVVVKKGYPLITIRFLSLSFAFLTACRLPLLNAQVDIYPFPKVEDVKIKKPKEQKPAELFVQVLSKKTGVPEKYLTDAIVKGFGRTELIRLILMSKKSGKKIEEIVQEREKGTRLAKIAESLNLNNHQIRLEAETMLKDIETEEENLKTTVVQSSTTIAGLSENLTKSTTNFKSSDSNNTTHKINGK